MNGLTTRDFAGKQNAVSGTVSAQQIHKLAELNDVFNALDLAENVKYKQ